MFAAVKDINDLEIDEGKKEKEQAEFDNSLFSVLPATVATILFKLYMLLQL